MSIGWSDEGLAVKISRMREAMIAVANELDTITAREEAALRELKDRGIEVSTYSLNFPSEQRDLAERLREALP